MNIKNNKAYFNWIDINETSNLGIKFDNAISNPPFHSNKGKNITLGKNFILAAHQNLKSNGNLLLVSNIQLPYERLARNLFYNCEVYQKNNYFKIILARRPKKQFDPISFKI